MDGLYVVVDRLAISCYIGIVDEEIMKTLKKKVPSLATLERWLHEGVALATDGCRVEPDGHCEHGKPSWLVALGVI